ncbi:hypothetical protein ACHWQZ_G017548 [Mnemiopsis leidyi]
MEINTQIRLSSSSYVLYLLLLLQSRSASSGDWKAAQRYDEADLEETPLEFRTNSTLGSKAVSLVRFFHIEGSFAGGIYIYFDSDFYYSIENCIPRTKLPANISSTTDKIWKVSLNRTSENVTLQIDCDQANVVTISMSDTTCSLNGWSTIWSRKIARFYFVSPTDTATVYYRPSLQGDAAANWTAVDLKIDLQTTPLEIKTNVTTSTSEGSSVIVIFYTSQRKSAGGITIQLTSPPKYMIRSCTSYIDFPTVLPTAGEKVWRITKTNGTDIRLQIRCNGLEMVNVIPSNSTCSDGGWSEIWRKDIEIFRFSFKDTASEFYRPYIIPGPCSGLKAEWTRNETTRIVTSTPFPVDPDTVIPVTCSNSDFYNKGSQEVVCITGTEFGYIDEPKCVERVPEACSGLKTEWTDQLTTAAKFPVPSGTVVEVTCSRPGHINTGAGKVKCVTGTRFTFTSEPSCYPLVLQVLVLILEYREVQYWCTNYSVLVRQTEVALRSKR